MKMVRLFLSKKLKLSEMRYNVMVRAVTQFHVTITLREIIS